MKNLTKKGTGKRILSLLLVLTLTVTMMQIIPGTQVTSKAADGDTNITIHFLNEFGWEAPAVQYWGGSAEVTGAQAGPTEISGWGGAQGYTMTAEKDGWYSLTLKGDFTGFQFLDMSDPGNNTSGKGYHNYMSQYTEETPVDLYCKYNEETAYECEWYLDGDYTEPLSAPADAPAVQDCTVTVHYLNSENWSTVYAYVTETGSWTDIDGYTQYGSWPGSAISENGDHPNWYDVTVVKQNDSQLNVIFNNNSENQTDNLYVKDLAGKTEYEAWCVDNILYTEAPESWDTPVETESAESESETEPAETESEPAETEPEETESVETEPVAEPSGEASVSDLIQVAVGEERISLQLYDKGVYEGRINLPAGTYTGALWKNGVETSTETSFAIDEETTVCFRLKDGVLANSVTDQLVHSAALVGNFMGIEFVDQAGNRYDISSWNPADGNAELDYIGGGLYRRTFRFLPLAEDVTVADGGYKVAFDDSWDYSLGNGASNVDVTIPAGTDSITVFVDEINQIVWDDVRTPAFESVHNSGNVSRAPFTTAISLIGTVRNGNGDWDASLTGYEFTPVNDTVYVYTQVFDTGAYSYKCVFDYSDWYEAEAGNRTLSVSKDNTNVVFVYNTTDGKLYDSLNNEDTVAQLLGMQPAPVEPAKAEVIDQTNGTTVFQMLADSGSNVVLYYGNKAAVAAGESLTGVQVREISEGVFATDAIFLGDDPLDIVYVYDVNGVRTLDSSNPTVTVSGTEYSNYTRDAFTGRIVTVPGTFPGPSWDAAANQMAYIGNGLYQYTFESVPAANYEFKIAINKTWDPENYGVDGVDHGANYSITVPSTQNVTVFYNDFSHRAVTTLDYVFADIALEGTGIPEGTKMTDSGLTGIYSVTVSMSAGTYADIRILYDGQEYVFSPFTLNDSKDVTFYFDPTSGIYYHNASDTPLETEHIYYNSKDSDYKSVYGAVATGEEVTFSIDTGTDAISALLVIKGVERKTLELAPAGDPVDGVQKWSVTTTFDVIGENTYYFAISNGSAVKIYADDDGYYGEGIVTDLTNIKPYDLVVYKSGYITPDWMKNAVVYQIFPDRFYDGDGSNNQAQISARGEVDYEFVSDWYALPENPEQEDLLTEEEYKATGAFYGDRNWSNEIYGGDLAGITDKISYLKALGVTVIYINPVFSSISSHRYDTSDYKKIDPILGTLGDFEELVAAASANGMHIVLDGVFNHVSDDSIYFDRYYKFLEAGTDTIGAYPYWAYVYDYILDNNASQAEAEAVARAYFTENYGITDYSYTDWVDVYSTYLTDDAGEAVCDNIGLRAGKPVYGYEGWWGYDNMPVIKSTNGSEFQTGNWADSIIYSEDGSSVTQYWLTEGSNGWRLDVANEVSDETWQHFRNSVKALDSDAVIIGEIWDDATEYLLGDMYDSVMNYMFRNAAIAFAKGGSAVDTTNTLEKLRERYPQEAFYAMMNLVASHDTTRLLSYLDGIDDDRNQKDIASAFPTYEGTSDLAKQRQYVVAFVQFTYAGAPTIYYGDEIGMVGADDPDDRRGFTWGQGNQELVTWYATLGNIRNSYSALRTGSVEPFDTGDITILSYVRRDDADALIVLANNSQSEKAVTLDLHELQISAETLTDLIGGASYTAQDGIITVTVPALSGVILTDDVKEISVDQAALAPAYDPSYVVTENRPVREHPADPVTPENPEEPTKPEPADPKDDKPGLDDGDAADTRDNGYVYYLMLMGVAAAGIWMSMKKGKREER